MRRSHSSAVYCLPSQRTFELITHSLPTKSPRAPHLHRATTEEPRSQAVATPFCVSGLNPGDIGPAPRARSLAGVMAQGFVLAAGTLRCALREPFSRGVKASYGHRGCTRPALLCLSDERTSHAHSNLALTLEALAHCPCYRSDPDRRRAADLGSARLCRAANPGR